MSACPTCGNVADGLKGTCVHQKEAVRRLLDELEVLAEYDEQIVMAEYDAWAAANPGEARALHERLERTVHAAIEKARGG